MKCAPYEGVWKLKSIACKSRERHTGRSLQEMELVLREGKQLVITASFHEFCDVHCCAIHIHGMPVGAPGLGFIHHIQHEITAVLIQPQGLAMVVCDKKREILGEVFIFSLGIGHDDGIPILKPTVYGIEILNGDIKHEHPP